MATLVKKKLSMQLTVDGIVCASASLCLFLIDQMYLAVSLSDALVASEVKVVKILMKGRLSFMS